MKKGANPLQKIPSLQGFKKRDEKAEELKEQLNDGVIEHSKYDWPSPVVFVQKSDDMMLFCQLTTFKPC